MKKKVISIIGAGPAGIASSIQLKRLGYEPNLFEMDRIGGLLWNANLVENYPGFPNGISGPKLINLMEIQIKQLGIVLRRIQITQLNSIRDQFQLESDQGDIYSDYVIIASGTKPKPFQINISESVKDNIHHDIKNILDINGKHIVIIGAGDAAFDHALNLSKKNRVSIINRGTNIKALQLLVDRTLVNGRITYIRNTEVEGIELLQKNPLNDDKTFRVLCNSSENGKVTIKCNEVVAAIGRDPQLEFLGQRTYTDKCILVGDVKNGIFRQASIAIGDGIKAAMKIHNQILMRN